MKFVKIIQYYSISFYRTVMPKDVRLERVDNLASPADEMSFLGVPPVPAFGSTGVFGGLGLS